MLTGRNVLTLWCMPCMLLSLLAVYELYTVCKYPIRTTAVAETLWAGPYQATSPLGCDCQWQKSHISRVMNHNYNVSISIQDQYIYILYSCLVYYFLQNFFLALVPLCPTGQFFTVQFTSPPPHPVITPLSHFCTDNVSLPHYSVPHCPTFTHY
jgi:hypothetical protein